MRIDLGKAFTQAQARADYSHVNGDGSDHADVADNTSAITGGKGPGFTMVTQAVVADATLNAFAIALPGTILGVSAKLGTTCAAGQDVAVDVRINGVSCLAGATPIDIVAANTTDIVVGTVDTAADNWTANQLVTVVVNETNAGGPTAANLVVFITYRLT